MMDTATLLATLRDRDVKLWVEQGRLKCSAPVGALDVGLRAILADRKEEVLAFVRQAEALKDGPTAIVPIKPEGSKRPIFAVSGHGGDVFCLLPLARHLDAEQPMFGVQPPGLDGSTAPLASIEALAHYEVEQIRRYQPMGPYLIAGHCAGGTLAFEVAQQLIAGGQQVDLLALIGSPFPTSFGHLSLLMARLGRHINGLIRGPLAKRQHYIASRLRRRLLLRRPEAFGVETAELLARQRVEDAMLEACRNYRPRHYPGQIDLFVTADGWHRAYKWRPLAQTVREHSLGSFEIDDLLLGPDVESLAALLRDRLRSISI